MNKTTASRLLLVLISGLWKAGPLLAQVEQPESQPTTQESPRMEESAEAAKTPQEPGPHEALPGPEYRVLRYDDDFSYLDGPEGSYQKDFFDPIKNIRLADGWRLSLGGEIRARLEAETHKAFGSGSPTQDTFFLHRYLLHADLRYRNLFRFYIQGINAMVEDRDGPMLPILENRFDFQQMFFDLRFLGQDIPLTLRFGRQEILYGKERLLSPLDWANTRRKFDGVKVFWKDEKFSLDLWYLRPVPVSLSERYHRKLDHYREEAHFYGAYGTYKFSPAFNVDGCFLALRDTGDLVNANLKAGDISLYTLGSRVWGRSGPWDYDGEVAGQWGKWAGDTIQAWTVALEGGHTFKKWPWSPRIGLAFDYASGDDDPTDGKHQTFNQLFPLGHAYLGWLDLVGRQNIYDAHVNLTLKPHKDVTTKIAFHAFWLAEARDALYNAGGAPGRRDLDGGSGQEVGQELDVLIAWDIDVHHSLLFGYSHLWDSNFIRGTGPSEDPDVFYVQYAFKF